MLTGEVHIEEENAALIKLCRKGDEPAFRELYLLYNKSMFNLCLRMLNDHAEAQDALQESFISAFKNISQYNGTSKFGAWLKRIVINKCIDVIRKKNPRFITLSENEIAEEEVAEEEENIQYSVEEIRQSIALLPEGYRVILNLYLFEDFTHKMIAEKLNISEGTSKSQYSRAKKKLATLMGSKKQNEG